jgi:hypothetical protein
MPSIKLLSRRAEKTTAVPVSDRNIIQIITGGFVLDPDGYNIEAVCREAE